MDRRDFLKTASVAAGALARGATGSSTSADATVDTQRDARISGVPYPGGDYPIRAVPHAQVTLRDRFWKPKVDTNAAVTIPLLAARDEGRGLNGNVLEAATLSLETHPNPDLAARVDERVADLRAQPRRGNAGFEVAAAYYHATGKRDLIEHAIAAADALYADFGRNNPPFSGGERDAINCLALYRVTGDRKHLDLAKHYLDIRGLESSLNRSRHNQSYMPVVEQREAVGHAVNCVSLMVSLVDVGVLTGLGEYAAAAEHMWRDIVSRKMYITGGIGTTGNEGFGEPYSLPTISAYAETCAVLMFATLNLKLFQRTGDSRYIDVLERGLYNNALSGISASGDRFFYVNRLASAGDGRDTRWERASLECCPPNLVRFLASMPRYIYAQGADGAVYVNLYVSNDARFGGAGGEMTLSVDSEMPWGGNTAIRVSANGRVRRAIKLRIPGWTRNRPAPGDLYAYVPAGDRQATIAINGRNVSAAPDERGYVTLDREWRAGDRVDVVFPFAVRRVVAEARVREARGRVAIERGPLVYCAEWPDAGDRRALGLLLDERAELVPAVIFSAGRRDPTPAAHIRDASLPLGVAEGASDLFGGVTIIKTAARDISNPAASSKPVVLIPYYVWANRGPGEMSVWLSTREFVPGDAGPAGGRIFYVNPNAAQDGWRYLEAAPVDQSGGAPWGCFRHDVSGARATGVGTGRQNTAEILAACAERGTAADLCASYVLNGVRGWFLPSSDELALMYRRLKATGDGDFRDAGMADNCEYWTSTQQTADMADHIDFADGGRRHYDDKDFPRRVRAIRAF